MLRLWLTGLLILASSCKKTNDDFCCTTAESCMRNGGDGELHPCTDDVRSFCDNEGTFGGVGRTCIEPPGATCDLDTPCEGAEAPVCHEGLCVECEGAGDCGAARPVCSEAHACESCTAPSDCDAFEGRPICEAGGGCIGCRDGGDCSAADAPVCDPEAQVCRGCVAGTECDSDVCDQADGGCVAETSVLYVEVGGDGVMCTRADPCGNVQDAVNLAAGQRRWILVAAGVYQQPITIDKLVRIVAGAGVDFRPEFLDTPVFTVSGSAADVVIDGGRIRDAAGIADGVACDNSATLTLRGVEVVDNADEGVDSNGCTLTIDRCDFRRNDGGGLAIDGGSFAVTNSFFARNGQAAGTRGGVSLDSAGAGVFEHNTVFDNTVQDGQVGGVLCLGDYVLRNNIISGNDSLQVGGVGCAHTYSLIPPNAPAGEGNLEGAPRFVDAVAGDLHLTADSPAIDSGAASDVVHDFDGDARPLGDGADMGADEVVP